MKKLHSTREEFKQNYPYTFIKLHQKMKSTILVFNMFTCIIRRGVCEINPCATLFNVSVNIDLSSEDLQ